MQKNGKMARWLLLTVACALGLSTGVFPQDNTPPPPPCSAAENAQFDFWIGEWALSWDGQQTGQPEGQKGSGTNVIRRTLGSCVVEENFSTADSSFMGRSWSVYVPAKQIWQQTWVDNGGGYLLFTGTFHDGMMELRSAPTERNGKTIISRMVFRNISAAAFDWDWQRSTDNGESWLDVWNIHYTRKGR